MLIKKISHIFILILISNIRNVKSVNDPPTGDRGKQLKFIETEQERLRNVNEQVNQRCITIENEFKKPTRQLLTAAQRTQDYKELEVLTQKIKAAQNLRNEFDMEGQVTVERRIEQLIIILKEYENIFILQVRILERYDLVKMLDRVIKIKQNELSQRAQQVHAQFLTPEAKNKRQLDEQKIDEAIIQVQRNVETLLETLSFVLPSNLDYINARHRLSKYWSNLIDLEVFAKARYQEELRTRQLLHRVARQQQILQQPAKIVKHN